MSSDRDGKTPVGLKDVVADCLVVTSVVASIWVVAFAIGLLQDSIALEKALRSISFNFSLTRVSSLEFQVDFTAEYEGPVWALLRGLDFSLTTLSGKVKLGGVYETFGQGIPFTTFKRIYPIRSHPYYVSAAEREGINSLIILGTVTVELKDLNTLRTVKFVRKVSCW